MFTLPPLCTGRAQVEREALAALMDTMTEDDAGMTGEEEWPKDEWQEGGDPWTRERAGFWDQAIAGSSARAAAVFRQFRDESCQLLGGTCSRAVPGNRVGCVSWQ